MGGRRAFTYIEGELAVGVTQNYEWITGHLTEALRIESKCCALTKFPGLFTDCEIQSL